MVNQANIEKASAMPSQNVPPLQAGATSPGNSAMMAQKQQTDAQMALISKSGGGRRRRSNKRRHMRSKRRYMRGGVTQVQVPPTPPGSSQASAGNYKDLTVLASNQQAQAEYDSAKSPGDTAKIQQAVKGGSKRRRSSKRGGAFSKWGCLSGGFTRRGMYKTSMRKTRRYKRKH